MKDLTISVIFIVATQGESLGRSSRVSSARLPQYAGFPTSARTQRAYGP
jgi:hypothetical protein